MSVRLRRELSRTQEQSAKNNLQNHHQRIILSRHIYVTELMAISLLLFLLNRNYIRHFSEMIVVVVVAGVRHVAAELGN